jgi:hypothetical protein
MDEAGNLNHTKWECKDRRGAPNAGSCAHDDCDTAEVCGVAGSELHYIRAPRKIWLESAAPVR